MNVVLDDGGRAAAGFKPARQDCAPRAIAIATRRPYAEVYARLREHQRRRAKTVPSMGVVIESVHAVVVGEYRWRWTPTVVGFEDLPAGRIIAVCDKGTGGHVTAVIDGEVHDLGDPTDLPIYGLWTPFPYTVSCTS